MPPLLGYVRRFDFYILFSEDEKNAKLLRIQNQLYPNDQCLEFYGRYARLSMGIMESQLCAAELNHTSCQVNNLIDIQTRE